MSTTKISGIILPSDPNSRQKIKIAVEEISNSMTRMASERDYIKDTIAKISDDHQLPKPAIKKMATIYHKQNIQEQSDQFDDVVSLYETVFGSED